MKATFHVSYVEPAARVEDFYLRLAVRDHSGEVLEMMETGDPRTFLEVFEEIVAHVEAK